jgi:hypothetical protein
MEDRPGVGCRGGLSVSGMPVGVGGGVAVGGRGVAVGGGGVVVGGGSVAVGGGSVVVGGGSVAVGGGSVAVGRNGVAVGAVGMVSIGPQPTTSSRHKHTDSAKAMQRFNIEYPSEPFSQGFLFTEFRFNPVINHVFQNADGQNAVAQDSVVKLLDIELVAKLVHGPLAQLQNR